MSDYNDYINYINNIIGSNYEHNNLYQLKNINNANKILVIINSNNEILIHNIISIFNEYNYKNKNVYKKNKNKIYKIVTYNDDNHEFNMYYSIYNLYKHEEYNSIIFFNKTFILNDEYEKILLKNPILPIILENNNYITIFNQEFLDKLINSNIDIIEYLKNNKLDYLYNIESNNNIFNNYNINNELKIESNKLFDLIKL